VECSLRSVALGAALLLAVARGAGAEAACPPGRDVLIWTSPRAPATDGSLRIVAVAEDAPAGELAVRDPAGRAVAVGVVPHGGPPWSLVGTIATPALGVHRIEVRRDGVVVSCREVLVEREAARPAPTRRPGPAWDATLAWNRATEALFSAWIEHLFDAPPEEELGFRALEDALRDPARNFLHDHLGLGEDARVPATPDCADLPYFLRAYFAWKIGLPFGFRTCSRGTEAAPPRCGRLVTSDEPGQGSVPAAAFERFARVLADGVQSGNARTALDDGATDLYPVPLARDAIRPGTVYADPYGHTLVVVGWVPQTAERSGLLLAVDAQPDDSVGRKRFWEGTFLFAQLPGAGAGFKAFRPLVPDGPGGALRPLANGALATDARFVPFSTEQAALAPEAFHARMGALVNPRGLDPTRAYEAMLDALVEQLETRVNSVDNGERYRREHPGAVIAMPEGAGIFETVGPWEDYSTPSRDLRLLIALHVLAALPERIVRHPALFVLGGRAPEDAREEIEGLHAQRIAERGITYTRSDGSPWRLTVADVLARRAAFEVAYDPNDCVEVRWGAAEGTPEHATCRRRAPAEQRARMEQYRAWFHDLRRPLR
jgi:hypothetical protein